MKTEMFTKSDTEEVQLCERSSRRDQVGSELTANFVLFLLLALYWLVG